MTEVSAYDLCDRVRVVPHGGNQREKSGPPDEDDAEPDPTSTQHPNSALRGSGPQSARRRDGGMLLSSRTLRRHEVHASLTRRRRHRGRIQLVLRAMKPP